MPDPHPSVSSARRLVAESLASSAASFPDLYPRRFEPKGLDHREAQLAVALYRLSIQRWLTIEHVIDHVLKLPVTKLEPTLRGLLLSAAAPLLFMDRQPAYAVVNEAVRLARVMVRPGAAGLVNAVLRRISALREPVVLDGTWSPRPDRLPLDRGYVPLTEPCLPPVESWASHLSVATSHPPGLVACWERQFGRDQTTELCLHDLQNPPTIFAWSRRDRSPPATLSLEPHCIPGFFIWHGTHEDLTALVDEDQVHRVQDPGTACPILAVSNMVQPKHILDFCAGRGTKTAQLANMFADARILATDIDRARVSEMQQRFEHHPTVQALEMECLSEDRFRNAFDLVVLDVPCSNTAVLARRPEAKYRYGPRNTERLVSRQESIVERVLPVAGPEARLLYCTCSLDRAENQDQVKRLAERFGLHVLRMEQHLPCGTGTTYKDGCFFALMALGEKRCGGAA